jgi:hypothetical protein
MALWSRAWLKFAKLISASQRSASLRSAFLRQASVSTPSLRSASTKFVPVKSAWCRFFFDFSALFFSEFILKKGRRFEGSRLIAELSFVKKRTLKNNMPAKSVHDKLSIKVSAETLSLSLTLKIRPFRMSQKGKWVCLLVCIWDGSTSQEENKVQI